MAHNVLAVYPGTFDPITLGHEDLVRRAAQLFDRVIVAVAMAHHKKTLFNLDERMDMARAALRDCPQVTDPFANPRPSFDDMVRQWVPLTLMLNSLNRSLGQNDAYPFALSSGAMGKLRFVHDLVHDLVQAPAG